MKIKTILGCGTAAMLLAAGAGSANAAKVVLHDIGGVAGSPAQKDFQIAAAYWASMFTNNVTIQLNVGFSKLDQDIIGSTGSTQMDLTVSNWEKDVNATKSNSTLDQTVVLPTLNRSGGVSLITNGADKTGEITTKTAVFSNGNTVADKVLYENTALVKAIGGKVAPTTIDGSVTFSNEFAFDFDPADGINSDKIDFLSTAIHEIGHALGFVSGTDTLDLVGAPRGPFYGQLGYNINDTSIFSALDMFRYSKDPKNLVSGTGAVLDESVGTASYFSIDGGKTALFGNKFSTGAYNGDGNQASHWKDGPGCVESMGIMDPTACFGEAGAVTALDLAAFDAMGWNLKVDALGDYNATTASIYSSLFSTAGNFASNAPEPASWAMMLGGFGFIGAAMRRRRTAISFG